MKCIIKTLTICSIHLAFIFSQEAAILTTCPFLTMGFRKPAELRPDLVFRGHPALPPAKAISGGLKHKSTVSLQATWEEDNTQSRGRGGKGEYNMRMKQQLLLYLRWGKHSTTNEPRWKMTSERASCSTWLMWVPDQCTRNCLWRAGFKPMSQPSAPVSADDLRA